MSVQVQSRIAAARRRKSLSSKLLRNPKFVIGLVVFALITATAVAGPFVLPFDPFQQSLAERLMPPVWHEAGTWAHPLGTDHLGRDYVSRLVSGAANSLIIGVLTVAIAAVIGTGLGLLGGYAGGWTDLVVSFIITVRLSLPIIVVALAVTAIVGNSYWLLVAVIGLLAWDKFAVVVRSATRQVSSQQFVTAARAVGCSPVRIAMTEVFPNIVGHLFVIGSIELGYVVILEATLSFLGLGLQPPAASWGLMIAEGKENILFDPWLITIPGVCLIAFVYATILMGEGLRAVLVGAQTQA